MKADLADFSAPSALMYGFFGWGVADGHRNSEELAARAELSFAPLMGELVVGTEGEHCSANPWKMLTVADCNALKHRDTMFPFVPIEVSMTACGQKVLRAPQAHPCSRCHKAAPHAPTHSFIDSAVAVGNRNSKEPAARAELSFAPLMGELVVGTRGNIEQEKSAKIRRNPRLPS